MSPVSHDVAFAAAQEALRIALVTTGVLHKDLRPDLSLAAGEAIGTYLDLTGLAEQPATVKPLPVQAAAPAHVHDADIDPAPATLEQVEDAARYIAGRAGATSPRHAGPDGWLPLMQSLGDVVMAHGRARAGADPGTARLLDDAQGVLRHFHLTWAERATETGAHP